MIVFAGFVWSLLETCIWKLEVAKNSGWILQQSSSFFCCLSFFLALMISSVFSFQWIYMFSWWLIIRILACGERICILKWKANLGWKINNQFCRAIFVCFSRFFALDLAKFSACLNGGDYEVGCLVWICDVGLEISNQSCAQEIWSWGRCAADFFFFGC